MSKSQVIEYFYAFDVHCNSFVPLYFFACTLQFLFLPILISDSFTSLIVSNLLYAAGTMIYCMVTTLGYFCKFYIVIIFKLALPFVQRTNNITKMIWAVLGIFIIITLMRINIAKIFLSFYLGN